MKKLFALLLVAALLLTVSGCGAKKEATPDKKDEAYTPADMTVACIKGPTGMGMAKLMEDAAQNKTANRYTFNVVASADEISGKIVTGEINIACVPTNLAAKLYNKTGGKIRMLAVNTLGTLSVLDNGNTVKSLSDLKGKTVYSIGEGSNPEYILRYILKQNKLENDVTVQFVASNDELIATLVSGKAEIAMVPEPAATTVLEKKPTLRRALSLNDEWEKISDGELMMGCVVALASYTEQNAEVVDKFLTEYEKSVEYTINSPKDAALLCESHEIIPTAQVAEKAIPNCNLCFIKGSKIAENIKDYFDALIAFNAEAVGGKLPGKDFYYEK